MPRKPIGETAMTDAERQARYRAARVPPMDFRHKPIRRGPFWMPTRGAFCAPIDNGGTRATRQSARGMPRRDGLIPFKQSSPMADMEVDSTATTE
jgi:hypothetical protein